MVSTQCPRFFHGTAGGRKPQKVGNLRPATATILAQTSFPRKGEGGGGEGKTLGDERRCGQRSNGHTNGFCRRGPKVEKKCAKAGSWARTCRVNGRRSRKADMRLPLKGIQTGGAGGAFENGCGCKRHAGRLFSGLKKSVAEQSAT